MDKSVLEKGVVTPKFDNEGIILQRWLDCRYLAQRKNSRRSGRPKFVEEGFSNIVLLGNWWTQPLRLGPIDYQDYDV